MILPVSIQPSLIRISEVLDHGRVIAIEWTNGPESWFYDFDQGRFPLVRSGRVPRNSLVQDFERRLIYIYPSDSEGGVGKLISAAKNLLEFRQGIISKEYSKFSPTLCNALQDLATAVSIADQVNWLGNESPTSSNLAPDTMDIALQAIREERARQTAKWGEQDHDNYRWLAILMEEVGELAQAILHDEFGGAHAGTNQTELIQVAAVAVQWLECMERLKQGSASVAASDVDIPVSPC